MGSASRFEHKNRCREPSRANDWLCM